MAQASTAEVASMVHRMLTGHDIDFGQVDRSDVILGSRPAYGFTVGFAGTVVAFPVPDGRATSVRSAQTGDGGGSGVTGRVRIGTSGWSYPRWRGVAYPKGLPHKDELRYLAERLDTVEINASFYGLQRPERYASWREQTPPGFVFAVKGSRFITHTKRLGDVGAPLANFFASGVLALGHTLGPLLWQLPPTLAFDPDLLEGFLAALPRDDTSAARLASRHDERVTGRALLTSAERIRLRHAIEVRHASFTAAGAIDLLRRQRVALVVSDAAARFPYLVEDTADFRYVRLHGHTELYASGYSERLLQEWGRRVGEWSQAGQDVYVYFDNDARARAPQDAQRLRAIVRGD